MTDKSAQFAWEIVKWDERHENHDTRKVVKALDFIVVPTEIRLSLRQLLGETRGAESFGVYVALAEVAARMPIRGLLANDNGPLTTRDMADLTGLPKRKIDAALQRLSEHGGKPQLQWFRRVEWSGQSPAPPRDGGDERDTPGNARARTREAAAALASSEKLEAAAAADTRAALIEFGIDDPALTDLSNHPCLTAAIVRDVASYCESRNKGKGIMIRELQSRARSVAAKRAKDRKARRDEAPPQQEVAPPGTLGRTIGAALKGIKP